MCCGRSTRALHDVWNALAAPPGAARGWAAPQAALEHARHRAPRIDFGALTARAVRADRVIKGRIAGDAWDELMLLATAVCALMQPIGLFGGTFDPIHCGHLRTAFELLQELKLAEIRFFPTGHPPHREHLYASAELRLQMVRAAVAEQPGFVVDDREARRAGSRIPSIR